MTQTIKPIETRYGGYHFRSRLEARWAVFFDQLKESQPWTKSLDWTFEAQGFELPSGWYLPDFHFSNSELLIEVKPRTAAVEMDGPAGREVAIGDELVAAGVAWMCVYGDPLSVFEGWSFPDLELFDEGHFSPFSWGGWGDWYHPFMHVPNAPKDEEAARKVWSRLGWFNGLLLSRFDRVLEAAQYAREARFEHGATP